MIISEPVQTAECSYLALGAAMELTEVQVLEAGL
jgi:hypothetical protein